jgi:DNA-binding cell septation regulator SpoVG
MSEITIFNLKPVGKGVLKATVSVRLGNGIIIHECKIIERDGELDAFLPQRIERVKGGGYVDLIEFEDNSVWAKMKPQILDYYKAEIQPEV